MRYKALPYLRVGTLSFGAQSANTWRRDWNVRNAIIKVLVLCNLRALSDPLFPNYFWPPQNGGQKWSGNETSCLEAGARAMIRCTVTSLVSFNTASNSLQIRTKYDGVALSIL